MRAQFVLFDVVLQNKRDIVSTPEHFSLPKDGHKRQTEIWTCFKRKLAKHRIFRVHISGHWCNRVTGGNRYLWYLTSIHHPLCAVDVQTIHCWLQGEGHEASLKKWKKKFFSSTHWKTYTRQWPRTFTHRKAISILQALDNIHNTKWFQWLQEQWFLSFFLTTR